jgi:hypothetical protein
MNERTEQIVYEESLRDLSQQHAVLDNLRARTGTLLTAASLVTAFLGARAFEETKIDAFGHAYTQSNIGVLGWAATGCFLGVLVLCLFLLAPIPTKWFFSHDVHQLMDLLLDREEPASAAELYRHLSYWNGVNSRTNGRKLNWMYVLFALGSALLAAETVLLVILFGTT